MLLNKHCTARPRKFLRLGCEYGLCIFAIPKIYTEHIFLGDCFGAGLIANDCHGIKSSLPHTD